jgi:type IV pilus assembly protein PilC
MANYSYIAKTIDGQTKEGNASAEDLRHLAQSLRDEGLILVKGFTEDEKKARRLLSFSLPGFGVSVKEKIIMVRNLGVMTSTGLSLVKIFDILVMQAKSKKFKKVLENVKERVNKGDSLSEAMAGHPDVFSNIFLSMVKIGEEAGTLEEVFNNLAIQLEKEHELKSKIKNAMIYPSILLLVMIAAGILVVTVVIPRLDMFFESFKSPIPIYTRIMLDSGNFAAKEWPLFIIGPLLLIIFLWIISKTSYGKRMIDAFLLKLPFFSSLIKQSNCALLLRSLSSLIASGVPLVRSLEVSSDIVGNFYFNRAIKEAALKVKKGESLSSALKTYKNLFPFGVIEMFEVGEETGKTSTILVKLAEFYENEVADITERLSTAIEPVLIVLMGAAVGVFAVSVIAPMYSMLGSIT